MSMRQGSEATAYRRDLRDPGAGMATVRIEVRPGAGVRGYSLFVDGMPATMDSAHRGTVICAGRCGDGSRHTLLYSFNGAPGSTLRVTLSCAGLTLCRLGDLRIGDSGPPWQAGRIKFVL
ncbi:MAG TPA: hypothetical protein VFP12_05680 [Allosphingosinicella sp.]|nr:hypothetical protein [Allosphingosinicella sp.]